ncbi:hypothetical protein QBC38DRAFT_546059 [Podospora fimiseda]|uniref:Uncharacterized protein n=1 Tax=Podospora fimiseda TaxID=252190 RepID=A0AAN7GT56_9PEZI|nr:hypothetical protein QBC38DRAFT_546059 [Podospora fimiseda]
METSYLPFEAESNILSLRRKEPSNRDEDFDFFKKSKVSTESLSTELTASRGTQMQTSISSVITSISSRTFKAVILLAIHPSIMLQPFTLPTRTYRRETATSEPLSQHLKQTQDQHQEHANARRSSTVNLSKTPFARRRLNVPNTHENRPLGAREVKSENVTPLRSTPSERFNNALARFETGIFPRREQFVPAIPSYHSTHSLPPTPVRQPLGTRQETPTIFETRVATPLRHPTFSFESPPPSPKLVVLPNKGGLEIDPPSSQNDLATLEAGGTNDDLCHPQIRSTSSSYPSEGIRSPDLCVSPPLTFGRRILSSLSGFGFSAEHLSFLESTDDEMEDKASTVGAEAGVEESKPIEIRQPFESHHKATSTQISQEIPLYPGENKLPSTEAAIVAAIPHLVISRPGTCPPQADKPHSLSSMTSSSGTNDEIMEDINLSTQCLPRLSSSHSFSVSQRPSIDQSHRSSFSASLKSRISDHFRRRHTRNPKQSAVGKEKNACCEIYKPVRVVKVKKWFARQFRAGRKGSRVIVMKVGKINNTHDKEQILDRKSKSIMSKSMRSRLMGVFGESKSKDKDTKPAQERMDLD